MQDISQVTIPANWNVAYATGYSQFDELLGNFGGVLGLRPGKVVLFSAQSGTGKTRLCLTLGYAIGNRYTEKAFGHFTGEQSAAALAIIGKTMGMQSRNGNVLVEAATEWTKIEESIIEENLDVVVIDSFPMLEFEPDANKKALSTKSKIKKIADFAIKYQVSIIILNHTDKKGNRAGQNVLMHLVDVAYTLRIAKYDDTKVIEFHCDKHREGSPIERAFPFTDGIWNLTKPLVLRDAEENEALRKREIQSRNLITMIQDSDGVILREDIDSRAFSVGGLAPSGMRSLIKEMVDANILLPVHDFSGGRGKPLIKSWKLAS